jgi:hypothetical protein
MWKHSWPGRPPAIAITVPRIGPVDFRSRASVTIRVFVSPVVLLSSTGSCITDTRYQGPADVVLLVNLQFLLETF